MVEYCCPKCNQIWRSKRSSSTLPFVGDPLIHPISPPPNPLNHPIGNEDFEYIDPQGRVKKLCPKCRSRSPPIIEM